MISLLFIIKTFIKKTTDITLNNLEIIDMEIWQSLDGYKASNDRYKNIFFELLHNVFEQSD